MITEYAYAEDSSDVKVKSANKISKGLKRLFIISAILLGAELIWLFGVSPFIPFSTIDVHSFEGLDKNSVLRLAGIDDTASFFSTNINAVKESVSSHILVETAIVIKRFPDKLSIFLTPRMPAAVAITEINGKPALVYVDRQGVFYKTENKIPESFDIPVISGIESPQVYMRLPDSLVGLTESISAITRTSPELMASISEIRIERKAWEGFELVLFPVHSSIKVRLENNLTDDTLRYMLLMLNVFESGSDKQALPEEIDFRSGMGSYKLQEQSL